MARFAISIALCILATAMAAGAARSLSESSKVSAYKPFRPYWKLRSESKNEMEVSKAFEGSSEFVKMRYHMGPVLTPEMHIYIVWYGSWKRADKEIIRDFINSISPDSKSSSPAAPSVQQWWSTVRLYTDQTQQNITRSVIIAGEHDVGYSHGHSLTRLTMQEVLRGALVENNGTLPANSHKGIYLILTAGDVAVQDFCRAVCGFHYFSFPSIVGYTLPYAWVGHSEKQCSDVCAYPFVLPSYMVNSTTPMKPPNGNAAVDGMLSVIGHELAEISSNPLINAWYAGEDPTAPTEIADLCEGMYGTGAGGGYPGAVSTDSTGANFNMNGISGRRFLIQWVWSPILNACHGPNASD